MNGIMTLGIKSIADIKIPPIKGGAMSVALAPFFENVWMSRGTVR